MSQKLSMKAFGLWRFALPLVPACITFGPLFMVTWPERSDNPLHTRDVGMWMLIFGLAVMFGMISRLGQIISGVMADGEKSVKANSTRAD